MTFIRGCFDICSGCGSELNLRTDVRGVLRYGNSFQYRGTCPACSAPFQTNIDRDTHLAGIKYMKQGAADKRAIVDIVEPVSPQEEELLSFQEFLDTASDETLWAELHASS